MASADRDRLEAAAGALERGRERDAIRMVEPVRSRAPEEPLVLWIRGISLYRLGRYAAAARELEGLREAGDWADAVPVLMDCRRAQKRHRLVDELWQELRERSPGPAVMAEGRIVAAGSLADRGRFEDAIKLLERAPRQRGRVQEHSLRVLYALADLQERAGNLPRARALFEDLRRAGGNFADVAERLASLS